jgi:hypothetical protein
MLDFLISILLIKKLNPEADEKLIKNTLLFLFYNAEDNKGGSCDVNVAPNWNQGYFRSVKKNVYRFLNEFYYIWSTNKVNGWKNFKLIPTFRYGRLNINYDTRAFYHLLCSIKKCPKKSTANKSGRFDNLLEKKFRLVVCWKDYLNLPKNKIYYGSFCTDGISVSLRFSRSTDAIATNVSDTDDSITDDSITDDCITDCTRIEPTKVYIGIDPGSRLFLGGVRCNTGDPNQGIFFF